jgi:hypothetical protein
VCGERDGKARASRTREREAMRARSYTCSFSMNTRTPMQMPLRTRWRPNPFTRPDGATRKLNDSRRLKHLQTTARYCRGCLVKLQSSFELCLFVHLSTKIRRSFCQKNYTQYTDWLITSTALFTLLIYLDQMHNQSRFIRI